MFYKLNICLIIIYDYEFADFFLRIPCDNQLVLDFNKEPKIYDDLSQMTFPKLQDFDLKLYKKPKAFILNLDLSILILMLFAFSGFSSAQDNRSNNPNSRISDAKISPRIHSPQEHKNSVKESKNELDSKNQPENTRSNSISSNDADKSKLAKTDLYKLTMVTRDKLKFSDINRIKYKDLKNTKFSDEKSKQLFMKFDELVNTDDLSNKIEQKEDKEVSELINLAKELLNELKN